MKIIAFGASYSRSSINKRFAAYAASQLATDNDIIEVIDLNDYPLPLFTTDVEKEIGHPQVAHDFVNKLAEADIILISLAEHNGSYTAAFKNLFDWASRVKGKLFENKKLLLLSTATGPRGGLSVLHTAVDRFPRHGAEVIAQFSLPNFAQNFSDEIGIINEELKQNFIQTIETVKAQYV